MADLATNVSFSLNLFGIWPSDLWGAFSWGVGKWGEGTNAILERIYSVYTETETPTNDFLQRPRVLISETQTMTYGQSSETLRDGDGYNYIFTSPVTNAENRSTATYTCAVAGSTSWTKGAAIGSTWT